MTDKETMAHEPAKRVFDPTINLGHVLTMVGMAGALVLTYSQMSTRLTLLEQQVGALAQIMERGVRVDERQQALEKRVDKLEERIPR